LQNNYNIIEIKNYGDNVFNGVKMPTCIIRLKNEIIENQIINNSIFDNICKKIEKNNNISFKTRIG
jgi:hypothetical protein